MVADSSQIEARKTAWLSGHQELLDQFATGADIYSLFASKIYQRHVDRKNNPDDFLAGFLAKCSILGLGFSMGFLKFAETLLRGMLGGPPVQFKAEDADKLGVSVDEFLEGKWGERKRKKIERMPSRIGLEERLLHCAVADKIVRIYRTENKPIVEFWSTLSQVIETMEACAPNEQFSFGPNECLKVERHAIVLPNGMKLLYPGLELRQAPAYEDEDGNLVEARAYYSYLGAHNQRSRLYSGMLCENLAQSLARIVVMDQALHMKAKYGRRPASRTHDELIYVEPESSAQWLSQVLLETMKTPPSWAKGLPLAAEGSWGPTYGSAK